MLETGVFRAIRDGRLVPVLEDWATQSMPISVLYWPSRHLSSWVRRRHRFIAGLLRQPGAAFAAGGNVTKTLDKTRHFSRKTRGGALV